MTKKILEIVKSLPISSLPQHIVIVPDGNRRWARKHQLTFPQGYRAGSKSLEKILNVIYASGIKIPNLSFWALSLDNVKHRSKQELGGIFKLAEEAFEKLLQSSEIHRARVKVNVLGEWQRFFPLRTKEIIEKTILATKDYQKYQLNFFLAYDGYKEILVAVDKIRSLPREQKLTPELFKSCLYTKDLPSVDFVIRTGGEPHWSSAAFLWDAGYSQLYFTKKLWPDFSPQDFLKAMLNYTQRGRRFGR